LTDGPIAELKKVERDLMKLKTVDELEAELLGLERGLRTLQTSHPIHSSAVFKSLKNRIEAVRDRLVVLKYEHLPTAGSTGYGVITTIADTDRDALRVTLLEKRQNLLGKIEASAIREVGSPRMWWVRRIIRGGSVLLFLNSANMIKEAILVDGEPQTSGNISTPKTP
jgi:hypothetical protein